MPKHIISLLMIGLMAASAAQAQGRRGGGGGGKGGRAPTTSTPAPVTVAAPAAAPIPVDQVQVVGVVQALGPEANQITVSYDAVEALNWPPGTAPFSVSKPGLLDGLTVGEKVRFRLEAHQISTIGAY